MRRRGRSGLARSLSVLLLLLVPIGSALPQADGARLLRRFEARTAEIARRGAMRRLQSPECRQVLTDFRDPEGRTMLQNLEPFGLAPDAYLARIALMDGASRRRCKAPQVQLVTMRGAGRVFVCKPFLQTVWRQRAMAEVYVIHEMLHTLGLGEDPPTSLDITRQVRRRCVP